MQLFENTAVIGIDPWQQTERECDRISLFNAREAHIVLCSQSWKYKCLKDTHMKKNAGHFRVFILLNLHAKNFI